MTGYLLDVNVLLALGLTTHQHHIAASDWFDTDVSWATTPVTESAYLRLMTNSRVVGYEIPVNQALDALSRMRRLDGHLFVPDDSSLAEPQIDTTRMAGSRQVTDFHLVNLAAVHKLALATFDGSLVRALHPDDVRHTLLLTD